MSIAWKPWSDDLLRVARDERRAVLLSIVAGWCRFCREMDRTTFADPRVVAAIADHAIAVRVDKDEQPDIEARYGQGGWPSTVILDPDGEVLSGGTWFSAEALVERLADAARRLRTEGPTFRPPRLLPRQPTGRLDDSILPAIEAALLSHFDSRHGGFGTGQKFPHPEALDFAILRQSEHGSPALRELIEKTLAHMAEGGLQDALEGGFFRYCGARDWRQPHTEKLLETNAGLLRNYLEAGQLLQRADCLRIGARTADALLALFRDERAGLFHASLAEDDEYYAQDAAGRRTRRAPRRDGRFLADANARAVSALLKAGAVLRRPDLTEAALDAAANLLARLWRPGHGMDHDDDGAGRRLPGLLRDQAETTRMLLHVLQYTDDRRFAPALEDLLEVLVARHVAPTGELADREEAGAAPRAHRREAAILDGAVAAEALLRAALYAGRSSFADLARRALEVHSQDFRRYGYAMAAYGRAVELVLRPPLHVVVVGDREDPRSRALFHAASETWLPSRVVQLLDPSLDSEHLTRLQLPARPDPVAYVCLAHDCAAEHREPETLWAALVAANTRRVRDA
ncbi:MAG TPA: DUF255 domain-containing protein [Planctomycetota bacterium]|nr:DUF255 domain-containing protein [Planctomycetota bacterium]